MLSRVSGKPRQGPAAPSRLSWATALAALGLLAYPDSSTLEAGLPATFAATLTQTAQPPGDGLRLAGWLTRPTAWSKGSLPAVILLHGWLPAGFRGSDTMQEVADDLARRGFVVLNLSLRGWPDTGGEDDCALRQPRDVARAEEWLAAQPGVDGTRMAVMGLSQGGQVALLAGVASPLVGAVVALAPPTDLARWAATSDEPGVAAYVAESCHTEKADPAAWAARNPILQAGRIRSPVLLVHGRADRRVPPEQSRLMAQALRRAGGKTDIVWVAGAGHDLDRIYDGSLIANWLHRHLG